MSDYEVELALAVDGVVEAVAPIDAEQADHRKEHTHADSGGALDLEGIEVPDISPAVSSFEEQEGEDGKGFIEAADGYVFQRPVDNAYNIDIYTDNSVLTMYINDVCAYTQRIYGIQKNCWSINNYGGSITVSDVKVSQQ